MSNFLANAVRSTLRRSTTVSPPMPWTTSSAPVTSALWALQRRLKSTSVPAVEGVRQLALPLCFVGVKGWDDGVESWALWTKYFSRAGYSSTVIELDPPPAGIKTSEGVLAALEEELTKELSGTSSSSFPPLLISSRLSSLVAEQYVSSHPLSGLLLLDPVQAPDASSTAPDIFPTPLKDFDYEPGFPLGIMESGAGVSDAHSGRLLREFGEQSGGEVKALEGEKGTDGFETCVEWMDENGL